MEAEKTFVAISSKNTNVSSAMARAYAVTGINGADARSATKNIKADQVYANTEGKDGADCVISAKHKLIVNKQHCGMLHVPVSQQLHNI
jgi:hypothetical protein